MSRCSLLKTKREKMTFRVTYTYFISQQYMLPMYAANPMRHRDLTHHAGIGNYRVLPIFGDRSPQNPNTLFLRKKGSFKINL